MQHPVLQDNNHKISTGARIGNRIIEREKEL